MKYMFKKKKKPLAAVIRQYVQEEWFQVPHAHPNPCSAPVPWNPHVGKVCPPCTPALHPGTPYFQSSLGWDKQFRISGPMQFTPLLLKVSCVLSLEALCGIPGVQEFTFSPHYFDIRAVISKVNSLDILQIV